jgi:amino acid transporter
VKEAMGGTVAKISVSALLFDYVLTGPISGVSAGQYLVGFLNELFRYARLDVHLSGDFVSACFATLVTLYFWWVNIKGIPDSSEKALRIMYVTTAMAVLLIGWCAYSFYVRGGSLPPWPLPRNLHFSPEALGWLKGTRLSTVAVVGVLIGLGHSVLAMSGEETLAQVYREIEHPKLTNLKKTALVIFVYSLVFTSLVSFFAVVIIPDQVRPAFFDNLIGGLTMYVVGPHSLRIVFHLFVVLVGVLILSGAVNTSMVGSNGVLNRISEDGVLPDWFRHPHSRFGTTHRIINVVAVLQLLAIFLSRGNVYVLGEAYAFGVLWSFALKSLGVLVLRFKRPGPREYRVPLNFRFRGTEIPVGLGMITLTLFGIAATNLLTKPVATISGVSFSVVLFAVFTVSERFTQKSSLSQIHADQFQLTQQPDLSPVAVGCRPGNILVCVGHYHALWHLGFALGQLDLQRQDMVVLHIRVIKRAASGEHDLAPDQLFTVIEQRLFTKVVALAEKEGKQVRLAVIEANHLSDGIVRAAASLQSHTVVLAKSSTLSMDHQARLIGRAWERLPPPRPNIALEIYSRSREKRFFYLGPHSPHLTPREIELLHRLWLALSQKLDDYDLHHNDVVYLALKEVEREMGEAGTDALIQRLRQFLSDLKID